MGVLVHRRPSVTTPGQWTGFRVAVASYTTGSGVPLWFSGGALARDLTLPKLRQRWASPPGRRPSGDAAVRVSLAARVTALTTAAEAIRGAADAITRLAGNNPQAAQAVAQAASDTLAGIAGAVEGGRGGPLTRACDLFDKASREPLGRVGTVNARSADLRAMSRLVHLMGQMAGDKDTVALLALLLDLARLSDTLAMLRDAQQRYHQAEAARAVAGILRGAATTGGHLGPAAPSLADADLATEHIRPSTAQGLTTIQQSTKDLGRPGPGR
jgi:hypothetical protein